MLFRSQLRVTMLQQTAEAFHDRGGARIGGDDFVEHHADFVQIRICISEQHLCRLGIAQHDRERLVDFVCDYRRDRNAVTERLAEAGDVRGDTEAPEGPLAVNTEPGPALVEDQDRTVLIGELAHPLKVPGLRLDEAHRLHDDCRDLALVLFELRAESRKIVVRERNRQLSYGTRHARVSRRRADEPVLPPVVAAAEDQFPVGVSARDPYRTMLNFQVEDGRVVFDVDLDATRRGGLEISAKLLRLARFVRRR